ncbi:MAG: hypothetical protein IKQ27_15620, partial [Lachnospiraceae bacterium]|nr:hypothetical protein [Lachnospiraceae bacterium]
YTPPPLSGLSLFPEHSRLSLSSLHLPLKLHRSFEDSLAYFEWIGYRQRNRWSFVTSYLGAGIQIQNMLFYIKSDQLMTMGMTKTCQFPYRESIEYYPSIPFP